MDFHEAMNMPVEELAAKARDNIAEYAEAWQGDTQNDQIARAIIGSITPLIDAISTDRQVNPIVFAIAVRQFMSTMQNIAALNALGDLRRE